MTARIWARYITNRTSRKPSHHIKHYPDSHVLFSYWPTLTRTQPRAGALSPYDFSSIKVSKTKMQIAVMAARGEIIHYWWVVKIGEIGCGNDNSGSFEGLRA